MADDPRAALASLEHQLRALAAELGGEEDEGPSPSAPPAAETPAAVEATPVATPEAATLAPAPEHEPEPDPPAEPPPAVVMAAPRAAVLGAAERVAAAAAMARGEATPAAPVEPHTGTVEVHAGPFDAADAVLAFRDAVGTLPGVRQAVLRRVQDGVAVVEVDLR